ncbi:MAG: PAS domain S-box protein [Firmicutes bacterium]|nr:PAS domain S-box protein [Bacillota bacterium]
MDKKGYKREVDNKENTSELEISQEMKQILESSYDGIWITDGEGRVLYMNSANEGISGFKREEVIGLNTQELLDKKLFSKSAVLQVLESKKTVTTIGYNYITNKRVLITGNPILDNEGNIKYILNNVRDITQLENMSKELKDKQKIINKQKEKIERLKALKINETSIEKLGIVANSPKMLKVLELAKRVGKFDSTILILGESGVGKEVVAKAIVQSSDRSEGPFIKVNCGAIPENLLESEFFGYEKGAFTGANSKGKKGMFELANKGTIFLDEVADLPLNLQVKVLRVIQEKKLMRVGGTKPIPLDVRIIAATNKNIEEMVSVGEFREDLYYRLNVVTMNVPPLRERSEDIPVLTNLFLKRFNEKYKLNKVIAPEVMDIFLDYHWPGNVRELLNIIENILVVSRGEEITAQYVPNKILDSHRLNKSKINIKGILPLKEAVDMLEEDLLKKAMKKYGTTRKAAFVLGVDQSTIVRKMQKFKDEDIDYID